MRYLLVVILIIVNCAPTGAQLNYVVNPSFEKYSQCPDKIDEVTYADYWTSLDSGWRAPDWAHDNYGLPEYGNECAVAFVCGVPDGVDYHQFARSGKALVSMQMFTNVPSTLYSDNFRDYLQTRLKTPLTKGRSYCVSFYVSLGEYSSTAANHIGAYFDDGTIDTTHNFGCVQSQYLPQVIENTIITDTVNWVKIEGRFIAGGSQSIMTIGQFTDSAHTSFKYLLDTTGLMGHYDITYSWYVIDDVSVIAADSKPNAGIDKYLPKGSADSVVIGDTADTYLPVKWYTGGRLIDSNTASLKVHPLVNTQYIEALELCGNITYDTVMVYSGNVGISNVNHSPQRIRLFPNPSDGTFALQQLVTDEEPVTIEVWDAIGSRVYTAIKAFTSGGQLDLQLRSLPAGTYILRVIDKSGDVSALRLVISE